MGKRIKNILFQRLTECSGMLTVNLPANSLSQPTKVIKTKTCRQLVINSDITLLAQFLYANLKGRRLAGQMCRLVIIRKIDSDVTCLAGLYPNQTFFEPGNKAARSQFQRMTLGRTTFKSLAIDASDEINKDNVAVLAARGLLTSTVGRLASAILFSASSISASPASRTGFSILRADRSGMLISGITSQASAASRSLPSS